MDSDINKKAISALGTIANANVGLSTKVPVQRPNQIPFEQVTLNQIKRSIIAECTTAADTANKTATVTNFADFELIPGLDILVYFKAANTAGNITLSINDSNAYPIKALGTADQLGNGSIKAGAYKKLTFTGDSFITEAPTISVMNIESALPLNSAAVNNALTNVESLKRIVVNNDTELIDWLKNNPYKQALLYLSYNSTLLGLTTGELRCFCSRDANIYKGIYTELYNGDVGYYVEFDLSSNTLRTKNRITTLKSTAPHRVRIDEYRRVRLTNAYCFAVYSPAGYIFIPYADISGWYGYAINGNIGDEVEIVEYYL